MPTKIFTGSNSIKEFIEWVFEQKYCNQIINKHFLKKLKMTTENENNYQNSECYWICNEKIIKNKDKVRDHCHITGKYRGPAHKECNSKLRIPRKLPIIFHNLEGYDGHLIFSEWNNFKDIDIQVIPETNERYMSIIVNRNIIFLDSLQFCKVSLDSLAGNLEDSDFKYLLSEFLKDKLEILKRKDSCPYEWVDSYINPSHYFSAPGLSWDAMLKMTKVELEKISNPDMHLFIEKGMRGGISCINKRYSKANNKYCPDYDKNNPENYIFILIWMINEDAMSEYLPYGGFKWVKIPIK